jgi:hypothetical protein
MSEHIENALISAVESKPLEFKSQIQSALQQKIDDYMQIKKMQIANSIFNKEEEESLDDTSDFNTEEENVDEDL